MSDLGSVRPHIEFLVPPLLFGPAVQAWLRRTFSRYWQVRLADGLGGAQVARVILDRDGLTDVPVRQAQGGPLSDYHDQRKHQLHLPEPMYVAPAVSAAGVAAHESGHALQHAGGYVPLRFRSAIFRVAAFASAAWIWLLLIGMSLGALNLVALALVLYAVAVAPLLRSRVLRQARRRVTASRSP